MYALNMVKMLVPQAILNFEILRFNFLTLNIAMAKYLSTRDLVKGANSSTSDHFVDLLVRRSLG